MTFILPFWSTRSAASTFLSLGYNLDPSVLHREQKYKYMLGYTTKFLQIGVLTHSRKQIKAKGRLMMRKSVQWLVEICGCVAYDRFLS